MEFHRMPVSTRAFFHCRVGHNMPSNDVFCGAVAYDLELRVPLQNRRD